MFQMLLPLASKMLTSKVMMSAGAKMMLSAGASALGTHLDNQKIKKQNALAAASARARQGNFYVNLRNAALRAGFNPLTVLRSGTAGAYQAAGNSYDTLPMLTSNSFANMLMDAEESQVRMDNMRAQERNMQHQQNMDKLNYELRKAELETQQSLISEALLSKTEAVVDNVNEVETQTIYDKVTKNKEGESVSQPETILFTHVTPSGNTIERPYAPDADFSEMLAGYFKLADGYAVDAHLALKKRMQKFGVRQKRVTTLPILGQTKQLPKLTFGPDYRDRLSLDGFVHNY
jgi:hypothetical protein